MIVILGWAGMDGRGQILPTASASEVDYATCLLRLYHLALLLMVTKIDKNTRSGISE